jgi:hypothetical protein
MILTWIFKDGETNMNELIPISQHQGRLGGGA